MKKQFFYEMYKIGEGVVIERDGKPLSPGYYKATYGLDGSDPVAFEYSKDRYVWETVTAFKDLAEFRDFFNDFGLLKFEREEYVETVVWKDTHVPVFYDDYGQCFYCICNGLTISFGSFQDNYEDEIRAMLDSSFGGAKAKAAE